VEKDEIALVVEGNTVRTLTYTPDEVMKQLIRKVKELGVEPTDIKLVPCG